MTEERELDLRSDGRIRCRLGEQEHLCRRPNVGELGKILELRAAVVEKEKEALKSKPSGATHALFQARLISEWVHDVLGMLSDKPIPAVDDLPGWATSSELLDKLILHWQSVPLGPSGA